MEFVLAYAAGLLTLINPCVLPVLPVVLAGALGANPKGPLALAAGMSVSFVLLGVVVTAFGRALGLDEQSVAQAGAVLMVAFGLMLLVPRFGMVLSGATAGMSARADAQMNTLDQGVFARPVCGRVAAWGSLEPLYRPDTWRRDCAGVTGRESWACHAYHGRFCFGCFDADHRTRLWHARLAHAEPRANAKNRCCGAPRHGRGVCRCRPRAVSSIFTTWSKLGLWM